MIIMTNGKKYQGFKTFIAVALATVVTLIVRLTVFEDDCNLFVVGMTFLLALGLCFGVVWLVGRFMA